LGTERYRQFYVLFPIASALRTQFSWTHYKLLLSVVNQSQRLFYEAESIKNNWSSRQLERQINSQLYERLLLSSKPEDVLAVAKSEKHPVDAKELSKDPMVLEFLGLKPDATYYERDLESKIITHLQEFLLELGNGFSFMSGFEFLNHPVTCLRQASSFTGTFSAGSLVPPLLSIRFAHGRRGV
jgi:predicted nuclease of restriction endonuclease-like (RecB) superfamily